MKNTEITFKQRVNLMNNGILKPTDEFIEVETEDGERKTVPVPEELHTFGGWRERGYSVKKGEKHIAEFAIWKARKGKKAEDTDAGQPEDGEGPTLMFQKIAFWFSASQVEPLKEKERAKA